MSSFEVAGGAATWLLMRTPNHARGALCSLACFVRYFVYCFCFIGSSWTLNVAMAMANGLGSLLGGSICGHVLGLTRPPAPLPSTGFACYCASFAWLGQCSAALGAPRDELLHSGVCDRPRRWCAHPLRRCAWLGVD